MTFLTMLGWRSALGLVCALLGTVGPGAVGRSAKIRDAVAHGRVIAQTSAAHERAKPEIKKCR
jgi:hypothetical protein